MTPWIPLGLAGLVSLPGAAARAQEVSLEPRLGVVIPVGELESFADAGVAGGLGAGIRIHPRVGLRVDLELGHLGVDLSGESTGADGGSGASLQLGDVRVWRYTVGFEGDLIVPGLSPLTLVVGAGAGGASLRADRTASVPEGFAALTEPSTFATARAGVRVGWDLSRRWNAFASLEGSALFTGEASPSETVPPGLLVDRGTLWAIPLTAGVRVRLY